MRSSAFARPCRGRPWPRDDDDDGVGNDNEDNDVDYQVNAGAILTVSLLQRLIQPQMSMAEKFDYILDYFTR